MPQLRPYAGEDANNLSMFRGRRRMPTSITSRSLSSPTPCWWRCAPASIPSPQERGATSKRRAAAKPVRRAASGRWNVGARLPHRARVGAHQVDVVPVDCWNVRAYGKRRDNHKIRSGPRKGHVTLPVGMRKRLGIKQGDVVGFELTDDGNVLIVVAASALHYYGLTILTFNRRHFQRIEHLRLYQPI